VAQLSQRDRAAEWISYGQKWNTVTGRQYFTDIKTDLYDIQRDPKICTIFVRLNF